MVSIERRFRAPVQSINPTLALIRYSVVWLGGRSSKDQMINPAAPMRTPLHSARSRYRRRIHEPFRRLLVSLSPDSTASRKD